MARISVDRIHGGLYTGRRIEKKLMRKLGECPKTDAPTQEKTDEESLGQPTQKKVREIIHKTFDITKGAGQPFPPGFMM